MSMGSTPTAGSLSTWQEVLVELPPYDQRVVEVDFSGYNNSLRMPEITMHCETCEGARRFECTDQPYSTTDRRKWGTRWTTYTCKNCEQQQASFALLVRAVTDPLLSRWHVLKVGQYPPHGPRVPTRLLNLLGSEGKQFIKGRRAEAHGFGIGAFGYYRRVVENLRNALFERVVKVAEEMGIATERTEPLRLAMKETRFGDAMRLARPALPDVLLLGGRNPFEVLHTALSDGLHEGGDSLTDEECLARAAAIRVVLTELAERLAELSRGRAELHEALKNLEAPRAEP